MMEVGAHPVMWWVVRCICPHPIMSTSSCPIYFDQYTMKETDWGHGQLTKENIPKIGLCSHNNTFESNV
jgi:hypothetical protein